MSELQSTGPNAEQIDFWNGWMADRWVADQAIMDRLLTPLSSVAIEAAAVERGERILDVGCGCGDTTLAFAEAGAKVTGIDISEPMLAHARGRAGDVDNPTFQLADAAAQPFAGDYDLVFSRFGVMFFADPIAAFSNLRTALSDDGRLCFLCWQRPDMNPWISVPMAAAQPFLPEAEPVDPKAPGPFAFADPDYVSGVLEHAGLANVRTEALERPMVLGADAAAAAEFVARIGPVSRALVDLEDDARRTIMDALTAAMAPHSGADGVALGAACWIVRAAAS